MKELKRLEKKQRTNLVSTVFDNGMVVTAEDLDTAMRYPLAVFQTLVRAYFGCGIVCGLDVAKHPNDKGKGEDEQNKESSGDEEKTMCVKVEPGVALDCHGYPLRLCDPVVFNLKRDPCACEPLPNCVCVAISRCSIGESPRLCGSCHGPTYEDWEGGIHGKTVGYWDRSLGEAERYACVSCHDPHDPTIPPMKPTPPPVLPRRVSGTHGNEEPLNDGG